MSDFRFPPFLLFFFNCAWFGRKKQHTRKNVSGKRTRANDVERKTPARISRRYWRGWRMGRVCELTKRTSLRRSANEKFHSNCTSSDPIGAKYFFFCTIYVQLVRFFTFFLSLFLVSINFLGWWWNELKRDEFKIKLSSVRHFFNNFFINLQKNKKNTTQNPESLLTMSTNSRIMISTPTAIYTRRQKSSEREKQPASAHTCKCRRELFSDQECVVVCGYYYAVIVTDFFNESEKRKKY